MDRLAFVGSNRFGVGRSCPSRGSVPFFFHRIVFMGASSNCRGTGKGIITSMSSRPSLSRLFGHSVSGRKCLICCPILLGRTGFSKAR